MPAGFEHIYECTNCRKMLQKSEIRRCSACKTMGYCSAQCQKADWKVHKTLCGRHQRNPVLKLVEKVISPDAEMMLEIDAILMAALDLANHPDRADTHAVAISCSAVPIESSMAKQLFRASFSDMPNVVYFGHQPDADKSLFQIDRAALLENSIVPPGLDKVGQSAKERYRAEGVLPGPKREKRRVIRAMWMSEGAGLATFYFTRLITEDMVKWVKQQSEAEPSPAQARARRLSGPVTPVQNFLEQFNVGLLTIPARKQKMTLVTSEWEKVRVDS